MTSYRLWIFTLAILFSTGLAAGGQGSTQTSQATAFIGTWMVDITEPVAFKSPQILRIWNRDGVLAATVEGANSPVKDVAGIVKDGNMLVLTIGRDRPDPVLENGVPIWAVYALTLEGDTMKVALMLEQSRTIKRGIGKKRAD